MLIDFNLKKGNEKQNDEQWYKVVDELIQRSKRIQAKLTHERPLKILQKSYNIYTARG